MKTELELWKMRESSRVVVGEVALQAPADAIGWHVRVQLGDMAGWRLD